MKPRVVIPARTRVVPSWSRWALACAIGETAGMAAAAGAAGMASGLVGEPTDAGAAAVVLTLAAVGGALEGLAIGLLQYAVLRPWLPDLSRRRWLGVTVGVAVVGWLLGMTPSTVQSLVGTQGSDAASGEVGAVWLMPFVGAVAGLLAGAIFGAAQAWALRGHVVRPWLWVHANALGWAAAMAVIFTGAALPPAGWPLGVLIGFGAVIGVLAGLAIGAVTGLFLPLLDDAAPRATSRVNRLVLGVLRSPAHSLLSGAIADLRYIGRRSGRRIALPVQYARSGSRIVIYPARADAKVWWRNMRPSARVEIGVAGVVQRGAATVLREAEAPDAYESAVALYRRRFRRIRIADSALIVDIALDEPTGQQES